ncbi:MAG: ATP-binding cassette domain-containing protein [Planctomycetales bacterium]|nr:ATP-binding cassette domain-containing protein [Planctomycetales bacterium]NIP69957.1 ATP-binding cassette domain-containing protein [Planctomycetales bacterium]
MSNFVRVLRLSLRYRLTVIAAVVCALAIALLWGGNIGTVYPLVEVVFEGRSLREWVDEEIAEAEVAAAQLADRIEQLGRQRETATSAEMAARIEGQLGDLSARREAELRALAVRQRLQPYVHRYLPAEPFPTLILVVAALLIGTLIKDVFLICSTILTERLCQLATLQLRKQFYRRTLRMDLGSFDEAGTSELISRFTYDMDQLTHGLRTLFGKAIREPLKMAACFLGAAFICWRLLLVSLLVAPVAAWVINWLSKSIKRANRRAMEEMSQIYNALSETFGAIKAVKAFTRERYERRRFHRASKQFYFRAMKIARYDSLIRPATELTGICTICLAMLAGAYLVLNQETHLLGIRMSQRPLSISSLLLFYGLLAGVSDPARKLSDVFTRIQRSAAAADRIYQMLDRQPRVQDPLAPVPLPAHHGFLRFENVSFSYDEGDPVLRDISLTIPYGQTLAVVGPNGCGKTTLVNLIPRFFDPQEGCVELDGIDLRTVRIPDLRQQIGLVTQEMLLFNDTVAANIAYGRSDATDDQVIHAARKAHAHQFITERLDDGYQTVVGEGGSRLSGGQRQRIALARAILRDPRILILDEATSQVDVESEMWIHRVLADFIRDRTAIIITHRLATLELADRILVMDEGQVADLGTHEELLSRCPLYRRLYQRDFRTSA